MKILQLDKPKYSCVVIYTEAKQVRQSHLVYIYTKHDFYLTKKKKEEEKIDSSLLFNLQWRYKVDINKHGKGYMA